MEAPQAVPNLINLPSTNFKISNEGVVTILDLQKYCMEKIGEPNLGRYCAALVNSEDAFIKHHNKVHNRKFGKCQFCDDGQIYSSLLRHWKQCESYKQWKVQNLQNEVLLCDFLVKDEDGNVQICRYKFKNKEQVTSHSKHEHEIPKKQSLPNSAAESRIPCPVEEECDKSYVHKDNVLRHLRTKHANWCGLGVSISTKVTVAPNIEPLLIKHYFDVVPSTYKEFRDDFGLGMVDNYGRLAISVQLLTFVSEHKEQPGRFGENGIRRTLSFNVYNKELEQHKHLLLPLYNSIVHLQVWKYKKTSNGGFDDPPSKVYHILLLTRENETKSQVFEISNGVDSPQRTIFHHRTTYEEISLQTGISFTEKCIKPCTWSATLPESTTPQVVLAKKKVIKEQVLKDIAVCFVCNKNLYTVNRLRDHLRQDHPDTEFSQCNLCYQCLPTYKEQQEHVNGHVQQALAISKGKLKLKIPLSMIGKQCDKCGKPFSCPKDLRKHKECQKTCDCGLVFCNQIYLRHHERLDH